MGAQEQDLFLVVHLYQQSRLINPFRMIAGYIAMWGDYLVSPNSVGASRLDLNKSALYTYALTEDCAIVPSS